METTRRNSLLALVDDPSGRSLGLDLPPGSLRVPGGDGPGREPLAWCADAAAGQGAWARLLPARAAAGLQPVLLDGGGRGPHRLAWDEQLDPDMMSAPADHDAEEVLAAFWALHAEPCPEEAADHDHDEDGDEGEDEDEDMLLPFGPAWPGLAPPAAIEADPDAVAARVTAALIEDGWLTEPRAGLVPAARGADIPAALGWTGPVNHEHDVARLCAVLRSWEDRFGTRTAALSSDRLHLAVAAPPRTVEEALPIAAEHFAFCPDNITQGYETIRDYVHEALLDKNHWTFWWD
jgi:Domain of unknown function (DUF4253)